MPRIYLSPPHMSGKELELMQDAFATNWIAPLGPHVDAFERELADYIGVGHAAALSSGTAALHLGLKLLGVERGDDVLCSSLTFCASANPIVYEGANPVFIDASPDTWNLDPNLVAEELAACARRNKLPRAVVVVDLYGQSADHDPIRDACARYDVPIIEDAAEALGATYKGKKAGSFGNAAIFSFNGNKIITSSGGGMLVSDDETLIERARSLATQARDPAPHYQHSTIGFNYRLSNVCAAIGRGQLAVLDERVDARRHNFDRYRAAFADLDGVTFMPEAGFGRSTRWLTCILVDAGVFGASRDDIRLALERESIEARPVWKPLHQQPVFEACRKRGGAVADGLFARGLCLPSGSSLREEELERIIAIVCGCAQ